MKTPKKLLLPLLLVAALALAACGDTNEHTTPTPTTTPGGNENMSKATLQVDLKTDQEGAVELGELLYGIFLEDINHAVDGGLYAELIKNRSFEYGSEAQNANKHGWAVTNKETVTFTVVDGSEDDTALNANNPNYAVISNTSNEAEGFYNTGFLSGMSITGGATYTVSFFAKALDGYTGSVEINLGSASENTATASINISGSEWTRYTASLTAASDISKARLQVRIYKGSVAFDMISLMPDDTYKGLPIRKDLGEYLEALNPGFLRFPGGCVIEGKDLSTQYSWKDSIGDGLAFTVNGEDATGDVATRPQSHSIWNGTSSDPYYTTYGIGFFEYFELCEALGCEAVPVLNAGMTCPVQSSVYKVLLTSSDEFKQYVQDALDLVEFCRGDASTKWGAVRIAMGHEEPFDLHYIGIGNEQWQSEYFQHYLLFCEAFEKAAKANPKLFEGVELIIANGPASGDRYGYNYIDDADDAVIDWTGAVDEHYYESPSWFFSNNLRYDKYDRNITAKVFLGEYAAQSNTLLAALAEASYMTALERNADIVVMSCYAPLFANGKVNQWTPDLIWYGSDYVYGSINYYVQKMFAQNKGATYIPATLTLPATDANRLSGKAGLGSWQTKVSYDNLTVVSNETGETLYSNTFDDDSALTTMNVHEGTWKIEDGKLIQSNTGNPADDTTGDAIYFGDESWTNYTLTVDATILGGAEGFLIPVCVKNSANNIFWNLGGWGNTVSCLQIVAGGSKSGQISGTVKSVKLAQNKTYSLKVVVQGDNVKCYLNDSLYVDYTQETAAAVYQSVNLDSNGDIIIKLVNTTESTLPLKVTLGSFDESAYDLNAAVTTLTGSSTALTNSSKNPENVVPTESTLTVGSEFTADLPQYSVSVIRIKKK